MFDSETDIHDGSTPNPIHDVTTAAAPPTADTTTARREQRILEFREQSLNNDDALAANLGVVNSDLMLFVNHMQGPIEEALAICQDSLAGLEQTRPVLEQFLKVTKQIDRFSQLLIKRAAAGKQAESS
jgi:hypothetical protein